MSHACEVCRRPYKVFLSGARETNLSANGTDCRVAIMLKRSASTAMAVLDGSDRPKGVAL